MIIFIIITLTILYEIYEIINFSIYIYMIKLEKKLDREIKKHERIKNYEYIRNL